MKSSLKKSELHWIKELTMNLEVNLEIQDMDKVPLEEVL